MRFLLNSDDSELLLALEGTESLLDLSLQMKRDVSVISRRLNKLNSETDFIQKNNGRWGLTEKGLAHNQWSRKAIFDQNFIFSKKQNLRIATTREFASRILVRQIKKIVPPNTLIEIITTDGGSEDLLLQNKAEIAIDCGIPYHPDIRFKKIVKEKMVLVSSRNFYKKNKNLIGENYIHFVRNDLNVLQEELSFKLNPSYFFNDLSTLRMAILSDYGYSLIPYYVVKEDLENKQLHDYQIEFKSPVSFGVWWKKDYKDNVLISKFIEFLMSIDLS